MAVYWCSPQHRARAAAVQQARRSAAPMLPAVPLPPQQRQPCPPSLVEARRGSCHAVTLHHLLKLGALPGRAAAQAAVHHRGRGGPGPERRHPRRTQRPARPSTPGQHHRSPALHPWLRRQAGAGEHTAAGRERENQLRSRRPPLAGKRRAAFCSRCPACRTAPLDRQAPVLRTVRQIAA